MKVTHSGTQKPTPLTVFNLQASDRDRCEEETGTYIGKSHLNYKLIHFFLQIFKFVHFAPKNMRISKNSIIFFFF